jgi:glycosyltransferase involved in cell wall biosynthesis
MSVPTVHVTIPTFNTPPPLLRRAVESVLTQTHEDLVLYVMNDGGDIDMMYDAINDINDPRHVVLDSPKNRGRYACDHSAVASISVLDPGQLWAPLDSDDWAEPVWLELLLEGRDFMDADVVFCDHRIHRPGRRISAIEHVKPWDGTDRLGWHAHLSGLWSVDFITQWRLTNPGWRIAWDTIMTSVPWVVGNVAQVSLPLVNRTIRPNSLTTAPATRFGSSARNKARRRCEQVWAEVVANPDQTPEILARA